MIELEQEDPIPQGDLALQITALPRETNGFGDIFGGWLVAQMDLAGTAMASKVAGGRVATVAIDRMAFLVPVAVGAHGQRLAAAAGNHHHAHGLHGYDFG